jgi:hypothetical protein
MKSNLNYKNPKKNIKPKRPLTSKNISKKSPNILAAEESKKIYQTQGAYPNIKIMRQLNSDKLELYLNILNPADIAVISKILPKYSYFQQRIHLLLTGLSWKDWCNIPSPTEWQQPTPAHHR